MHGAPRVVLCLSPGCRNQLLPRPAASKTTVVWVAQSSKSAAGRVVALFNLGSGVADVVVSWAELGLSTAPQPSEVRELWGLPGKPVVADASSLTATLASHDAVMVRVGA